MCNNDTRESGNTFWRAILKVGIAAIIVGSAFLLITSLLEILHGLQALLH